jgi:hypothetical protein
MQYWISAIALQICSIVLRGITRGAIRVKPTKGSKSRSRARNLTDEAAIMSCIDIMTKG